MEEYINKIFDKLASADISPKSNYSVPEYWMHNAIRGNEKDKQSILKFLSNVTHIDVETLNKVFNKKIQ